VLYPALNRKQTSLPSYTIILLHSSYGIMLFSIKLDTQVSSIRVKPQMLVASKNKNLTIQIYDLTEVHICMPYTSKGDNKTITSMSEP